MSYADLVLVRGEQEVSLGRVGAGERCDLGFVEDLLQLQLVVRRFGWSVRLDDVAEELRELVGLVGLGDELGTYRYQPSRKGGSPNSAKRSG